MIVIADDDSDNDDNDDSDGKCLSSRQQTISSNATRPWQGSGRRQEDGANQKVNLAIYGQRQNVGAAESVAFSVKLFALICVLAFFVSFFICEIHLFAFTLPI